MSLTLPPDWRARMQRIRMLVLDVDGVLTDGTLYFSEHGEALKTFNIRDGHGIKLLAEAGVACAIITGRRSKAVEARARNLGIEHLIQGAEDKRSAFASLLERSALSADACAAIGDDVLDLPILTRVAFAATVPEAPRLVRDHAHYVTTTPGGRGAVRELAELILQGQGKLEDLLARYLQ